MSNFNYKNRNQRIVKIKQDRICSCCGTVIPNNSNALTTNLKREGRKWYCLHCVQEELERKRLEEHLNHVSFDDEGSAQFYIDELAKHPMLFG